MFHGFPLARVFFFSDTFTDKQKKHLHRNSKQCLNIDCCKQVVGEVLQIAIKALLLFVW